MSVLNIANDIGFDDGRTASMWVSVPADSVNTSLVNRDRDTEMFRRCSELACMFWHIMYESPLADKTGN
jgi:hypothetical protein